MDQSSIAFANDRSRILDHDSEKAQEPANAKKYRYLTDYQRVRTKIIHRNLECVQKS
jgi:hypothetical protein